MPLLNTPVPSMVAVPSRVVARAVLSLIVLLLMLTNRVSLLKLRSGDVVSGCCCGFRCTACQSLTVRRGSLGEVAGSPVALRRRSLVRLPRA
jgi:hypothetical protein